MQLFERFEFYRNQINNNLNIFICIFFKSTLTKWDTQSPSLVLFDTGNNNILACCSIDISCPQYVRVLPSRCHFVSISDLLSNPLRRQNKGVKRNVYNSCVDTLYVIFSCHFAVKLSGCV